MTYNLENRTRREFLKKAEKVTLGIMVGAGAIGLLGKSCRFLCPAGPVSIETYTDKYPLFNSDVTLRKIETDGNFRMNGDVVLAVKYEFDFNEPGNYLFEGWAKRYRATDKQTEKWAFEIVNIPATRAEDLHSFVYRLEASRVVDGKIQRETVNLKHYGRTGASLVSVGNQTP